MPAQGKRRAYGQHFLRDQSIIRAIAGRAITEAQDTRSSTLLEIGPGKGAITRPLLELLRQNPESAPRLPGLFVICEKDSILAAEWKIEALNLTKKAGPKVEVHEADFLELPEEAWLSNPPITVVSNLPYSSGTAIVLRLAEKREQITSMVLMFQAEVAKRLRASPGEKAWGSLSIWIQNEWDVTKLISAPRKAFAPPPDVESEVVVLKRRSQARIAIPEGERARRLWEGLLKGCFAHRRKMLRSGLAPFAHLRKALEVSGVDDTKRAEALSWEEWGRLYEALLSTSSG